MQAGDRWESLWPDATQRDLIRRVNRMNTRLRAGMTLAVPDHLTDVSLRDLCPLPQRTDVTGAPQIHVALGLRAWAAYDIDGKLLRWGPISSGKDWCPDTGVRCSTPAGDYTLVYKKGADCKSSKFPLGKGGAPMPYCMFFDTNGHALHGSPTVPGYPDSHGCVRLFVEDAKWLNESFVDRGTRILVQE